jgi:phosphoglycerate dehydrogenase-like enzyme
MGFVICFARNFHRYIMQQARHHWEPVGGEQGRSDFLMGPSVASSIDLAHRHLADCTLGVVGVGQIGSEVARRAHAFGMRVLGVDPKTTAVPGAIDAVWPFSKLDDLLSASDFVVISAPHTPATAVLFRMPRFVQMKRDAVLINVGRGAIVNLDDLTKALERGVIGGAGLDVFEIEPLPENHRLWQMPNVIITPHIAGTSPRIAQRHLQTLLENVRLFAAGRQPATLVDKRQWY